MSIVHIPFYPSDWLAGTLGLSDAEKGVYITLIARMYEMAGPIERDDERLYRICGSRSKASFVKALKYLISEGKIIETSEGLFNERAQKVIEQTVEKSSKAKAAAQSRWDRKSNKNNGGNDANASGGHMPEGCQLELEPELYKEEPKGSLSAKPDDGPKPLDEITEAVSAYNATAEASGWPKVAVLSKARRSALAARLREAGGIAGWHAALAKAQASSHCCGQNDRGWTANFDFLSRQSSFAKLMEGNYDDRTHGNSSPAGTNHARSSGPHNSLMAGFAHVANQNS